MDPESIPEIQRAITAELEDSEESYTFTIDTVERQGSLWSVQIAPFQSDTKGLDESYEESRAWWPGQPPGAADVLSIVPEENKIFLRYATRRPPGPGEIIRIYPPVYMDALKARWDDRPWAQKCLAWLQALSDDNRFDAARVPSLGSFDKLRTNQRKAFQLLGWRVGFLWGPPGTGKSYTLGRMLARYLLTHRDARVLLLSTTNNAVDIALVYLDEALREAAKVNVAAEQLRRTCSRLGNHFVAANYVGREHLLPVKDPKLVQEMVALEARRPDKEDAVAYGQWKEDVERLRYAMRQQATGVLERARLVATTTTRAVFTFEQLRARAPYDLLVFDEASQVPRAMALALAPLARGALIAGDPQQLAPIVRSKGARAQTWIGESMFKYKDRAEDATCFLDEQSRMAETICRIVSNVFYPGKGLRVAADCKGNGTWKKERAVVACSIIGSRACHLERIAEDGQWSQRYDGHIRHGSAMFIKELVAALLKLRVSPDDVLVLTPFRAQRRLIRACLKQIDGLPGKKVSVSTVHRAQGTERHTIIFDPVKGESDFLLTPDLINVAISRAKARFVLILSPGDLKNPVLRQVANVIEGLDEAVDAVAIEDLASRAGFPHCAIGKVVKWGSRVGRVVKLIDEENKLVLLDRDNGAEVAFRLDSFRPKALTKQPSGAHDLEARIENGRRAEATRRRLNEQDKTLGQLKYEHRLGWEKLLTKLGLPIGIGITRDMTLAQARALATSSKKPC